MFLDRLSDWMDTMWLKAEHCHCVSIQLQTVQHEIKKKKYEIKKKNSNIEKNSFNAHVMVFMRFRYFLKIET